MDRFRAVHRYADQEVVFFEETAPFIVNGKAVGLQRIYHTDIISVEALFKLDHFSEKTDSPKRGLPALKCEADLPVRLAHGLPDQILHRILGHHPAKRLLPFIHFITVKAVVASHIAHPGSGFNQNCM